MVQGTVLAIQGVVLHTVVIYQYWYCTGKYRQGTGGSIGYTGGVGVTVGERIAGEVICEVAVGKKYKSRKTYNCEVVER